MALRLVQFLAAAVLLGSSLSFLSAPALARMVPARALLGTGAAAMAAGAACGLLAQIGVMAGSLAAGFDAQTITMVVSGMNLGRAAAVRVVCGLIALAISRPVGQRRTGYAGIALCGAAAAVSFAWSGHGAASEGAGHAVHLAADGLHALAGCAWVGFLIVFAGAMRAAAQGPDEAADLHHALHRFSRLGTGFVGVLLLTGGINGWFVVGPGNVGALASGRYGQLLLLKLALFTAMLGLAAANRFRLVPRLGAARAGSLAALRRSVFLETTLGAAVLALVAVFGALAPPAML